MMQKLYQYWNKDKSLKKKIKDKSHKTKVTGQKLKTRLKVQSFNILWMDFTYKS